MFGDWIYYPGAILLLLANLAGWAGILYRLPGHWVIVANCTLSMSLLPQTASGVGLSWFSICLIAALAILGDSFNHAARRHKIFSGQGNPPVRQRVLVGAGIGSVTCVVAGMAVPVIGSLLAVLGAVGGAAGGAYLGSIISPRQPIVTPEDASYRSGLLSRFFTEEQIRMIPRLLAGILMILIATYSSLF